MKEEGYITGKAALFFLAGGIIGAGIALLTAPKSGKETREAIQHLTEEATHKIKSVARDSADKIMDACGHGVKRVA